MKARTTLIDGRFDKMNERLEGIDATVERIERGMDGIIARLDGMIDWWEVLNWKLMRVNKTKGILPLWTNGQNLT